MPILNVILNGARGGQGTSTIAAALALYAAGHASTQLVAVDMSATAALLGLPEPTDDEITVTDHLTLACSPLGVPDIRIVDAGTEISTRGAHDIHLMVLRGPCYVALRSLVRSNCPRPDGIVLLSEPGRCLTDRDVRDVTGVAVVATVPVTAAVARTIDAGLFVARLDRLSDLAALRRYATRLLRPDLPRDRCGAPSVSFADLNESRPFCPVKIGTDLPVALNATSGGKRAAVVSCRSRVLPARRLRAWCRARVRMVWVGPSISTWPCLITRSRRMRACTRCAWLFGISRFSCNRSGREARNDERQQVKTLAHELGHAILHEPGDSRPDSRPLMELEAESVAYVVCHNLGINTEDYTFGYVATWAGGSDEARDAIKASGSRIQKAADQILTAIEAATDNDAAEVA